MVVRVSFPARSREPAPWPRAAGERSDACQRDRGRTAALSLEAGVAHAEPTTIFASSFCNPMFVDLNGDGLADWLSVRRGRRESS